MIRMPNLVERLQRQVKEQFFVDTAVLIQYTNAGFDEYGQPVQTETETEVECSFTDKPNMENWREYADIENINAEIRYTGTKATKGDRFRLVHRFEHDVYAEQKFAEQEFEVVGIRDRDTFGYVCALREVQL